MKMGMCRNSLGELPSKRRTRPELIKTFKKILFAVDRELVAARAAEVGVDLARKLGADVALIHVIDTSVDIGTEAWTSTTELLGVAELQGSNLLADHRQQLSLDESAFASVVLRSRRMRS